MSEAKSGAGNFFEDFRLGQCLEHATPRTLTEGAAALYLALTGSRFVLQASQAFALRLGYGKPPLDDLLVFHTVFGKSVPDISLNAIANLGYAQGRFLHPVHAGETLTAASQVIGLKENSSGKSGIVYVRTDGRNDADEVVLSYVRWVMVTKRDPQAPAPPEQVPELADCVAPEDLFLPHADYALYDTALSGSPHLWEDYAIGEKIDHRDGVTVEEAEHMLATRLYQNTARVHFNALAQAKSQSGKRLVYGGHVISLARALSFNGLANAISLLAINGGRHANPVFAGDTVFAWSEVLDKAELRGRRDCGALRLRLVAVKNRPCGEYPDRDADGRYPDDAVLDLDYWALMPRRR